MTAKEILENLPYDDPFLFVDEITFLSQEEIKGKFFYSKSLDFYKGHFKHHPITPGVILIETMAQIGLVCFGMYLLGKIENYKKNTVNLGMTSSSINFLRPVYPEETVEVHAQLIYFRYGKLKCNVSMRNEKALLVSEGNISGMLFENKL